MTRFASSSSQFDGRDFGLLAVLLALLAGHVFLTFEWDLPLFEDAAILMRYSRHLAEGHGIVWNIGQQPVDGATDFLLMVTLAGMARWCGMTVEAATDVLGFASHTLTVIVLYVGVRRLHGAPRWVAFLSAGFLLFGPGIRYIEANFGTTYFALFAATTWYLATRIFRDGETPATAVGFASSALLLGLTRPEGVFLAVFMLLALVLTRGARACRRALLAFAAVYGTLGAAYFVWHWVHFQYPLPNTYYIKGRDGIYWKHLIGSSRHVFELTKPFALFVAFALSAELFLGSKARRAASSAAAVRELLFLLFPFAAFIALSVLHAGLMDYRYRFAYCMVPLVLLGWPPLLGRLLDLFGVPPAAEMKPAQATLAKLVCAGAVIGLLGYQVHAWPPAKHHWWGTYNVAKILSEYPRDYTIAVTNAGHLPYVSRWNAVDGWGLNDQEIAHQGLSAEYLERWKPEVIQFDAGFSPQTGERSSATPWSQATLVMKHYAEANDYVLAAAYGTSPGKTHYYYVRRGFPHSDELVQRIRDVEYYLGGRPQPCTNYAE